MKLDYSQKDRNWHIYSPENPEGQKPPQIEKTRVIIGVIVIAVVVIVIIVALVMHKSAPKPTVQSPDSKSVVIPLDIPSAQAHS